MLHNALHTDLKLFKELRCEDYVANRKGPQAGGAQPAPAAALGFGQTSVAPTTATGMFNTGTTSLFGQTQQNKPMFGVGGA